jgi:hypothetical protein
VVLREETTPAIPYRIISNIIGSDQKNLRKNYKKYLLFGNEAGQSGRPELLDE